MYINHRNFLLLLSLDISWLEKKIWKRKMISRRKFSFFFSTLSTSWQLTIMCYLKFFFPTVKKDRSFSWRKKDKEKLKKDNIRKLIYWLCSYQSKHRTAKNKDITFMLGQVNDRQSLPHCHLDLLIRLHWGSSTCKHLDTCRKWRQQKLSSSSLPFLLCNSVEIDRFDETSNYKNKGVRDHRRSLMRFIVSFQQQQPKKKKKSFVIIYFYFCLLRQRRVRVDEN